MKRYIRTNQRVYDALADEYAQRVARHRTHSVKIAQPFIDHLKRNFSQVNVLELGCGAGLNLMHFESEGFIATTVELSSRMINVARNLAPKTSYISGDFLECDLGHAKFEGIFANAFIHLFKMDDLQLVMAKILSLLKENGLLFLSTTKHRRRREGFIVKHDYSSARKKRYRQQWTEAGLRKFLSTYPLEIVAQGEIDDTRKQKLWMYFVLRKRTEGLVMEEQARGRQ